MDQELAAKMVAIAKRQAYEELIYESRGQATDSPRRVRTDTVAPLAMHSDMMRRAAVENHHNAVQFQRVETERTGNLRRFSSSKHQNATTLMPNDIESEIFNSRSTTTTATANDPDLSLDVLNLTTSTSATEHHKNTFIELQNSPKKGDEELFRLTASPGRKKIFSDHSGSSSSEDHPMIFTDQSASPAATPHMTSSIFRDEPLQFLESPPRRKYVDMNHLEQSPTFNGAAKFSNTSSFDEVFLPADEEAIKEVSRGHQRQQNNTTLNSESSNEIVGFEDEHQPEDEERPKEQRSRQVAQGLPYEKEYASDSFIDWIKSNRSILIVFVLILVVVGISIGLRNAFQSNTSGTAQESPTPLPDTIEKNRTDATIAPGPPTTATTGPPSTMSPTTMEEEDYSNLGRPELFFQLVTSVSGQSPLLNPTTPQAKAFTWLVETDTFLLDDRGYDKEVFYQMVRERYILALLYYSTANSNGGWRNEYFLKRDVSICEWNDGGQGSVTEGISCEATGTGSLAVTAIVLDVNRLDGEIPTELGRLTTLKRLGLGSNSIAGSIPTELGQLVELTSLGLQGNYLVGSLPSELGQLTKLHGLVACKYCLGVGYMAISYLANHCLCRFPYLTVNNALGGSIPASFQSLTDLKVLFLEATSLTGNFDSILCSGQTYQLFYANCGGESPSVICSCCTHCCLGDGIGCQKQDSDVIAKINFGN